MPFLWMPTHIQKITIMTQLCLDILEIVFDMHMCALFHHNEWTEG